MLLSEPQAPCLRRLSDTDYQPSNVKPYFAARAFARDMELRGGHFPCAVILTFFRAPHTRDLIAVEVAFLRLPWDGTAMNRSGQREHKTLDRQACEGAI